MVNSIAIDGPAASGKSTLAQSLADHLDYLFFDTGVMYRAVTYAVLSRGLDVYDENACTQTAQDCVIDVRPATIADGRPADVLVDGVDRTWQIREAQVDANVSIVAAYPGVRRALSAQQRKIGLRGEVVMVGRDIGTVVLPEAYLKVYLDASVEERARRRYEETLGRGDGISYEEILASMRKRDEIDASRDIAPLRPADDAIIIDSEGKDAQAVLQEVIGLVPARDG